LARFLVGLALLGIANLATMPASARQLPADRPWSCGTVDALREGARGVVSCNLQLPNVVESEHFSIQWGNSAGGMSTGTGEYLLDALEAARAVYLDAGYPEPAGNPDLKVPFYLGNSGSGAPPIDFDGGYTTVCAEWEHAYVVLSWMSADGSNVDVANHELFHAVQFGAPDPYSVEGFYWEASATWAEELARPDLDIYHWFLPYYLSIPHYPMDYQDWSSQEGFLHPYAMFILPMAIGEFSPHGQEALLRAWTGAGGGLIPRMEALWEERGDATSFAEQFGIFTAHVSVHDFQDGDLYRQYGPPATREILQAPAERDGVGAPERYGTHYWKVEAGEPEGEETKLVVDFDGAGEGGWVVVLNRSTDGRTALPTVGSAGDDGAVHVEGIDFGTLYSEAWVTVTATEPGQPDYELRIDLVEQDEDPGSDLPDDDDDDDDDDDGAGGGGRGRVGGGGCSGPGGSHPFAWGGPLSAASPLWLLPGPSLARRRRVRPAAPPK
jgi:hypothetical protein